MTVLFMYEYTDFMNGLHYIWCVWV